MMIFTSHKISHQKVVVPVDLREPPAGVGITACSAFLRSQQSRAAYMTVGDLHASALRLITHLAHASILTVTDQHYCDIKRVLDFSADKQFFSEKIEPKKIKNDFDKAVNVLTIQTTNTIGFRSIGDNLADRDVNDYFILKLYSLIQNKKILYSNHDAFFMYHFQKLNESTESIIQSINDFKKQPLYLIDQHRSFLTLAQWVADRVVTFEELQLLIKDYQSALCLLDYDVDVMSNHISIYSHAPIDFAVIQLLAKYFEVNFSDKTINDLCRTIDQINSAFKEALKNPEAAQKIYNVDPTTNQSLDAHYIYNNYPLFNITWSRPQKVVYDSIHYNEDSSGGLYRNNLYLQKKNYHYTFVHGHVGEGCDIIQTSNFFNQKLDSHYVNIDTRLGQWFRAKDTAPLICLHQRNMVYYLAINDPAPAPSAVAVANPEDHTQPHLLAPSLEERSNHDTKKTERCFSRPYWAAFFSRAKTQEPVGSHIYPSSPSCQ